MPPKPPKIRFKVVEYKERSRLTCPNEEGEHIAYLVRNDWDDFGFQTLFILHIASFGSKNANKIGEVKIGKLSLKSGSPKIPNEFDSLDERFFSLGTDEPYYENIVNFFKKIKDGEKIIEFFFESINDVAFNTSLYDKFENEVVMKSSLMRALKENDIKGRFHRLSKGDSPLISFSFSYVRPKEITDFKLEFSVNHDKPLPTNVHVLIGANGAGKTHLIYSMALAFLNEKNAGKFIFPNEEDDPFLTNIVAVSFSAFDSLNWIELEKHGSEKYSYVGLIKFSNPEKTSVKIKSVDDLTNDFINSINNIRSSTWKRRIWTDVAKIFEGESLPPINLFSDGLFIFPKKLLVHIFRRLSSGHKIVLLTLIELLEKVTEKTLVLIDELETHLHPSLLSATIRAISKITGYRNGVAIIATHSPVILQEVPKSCAWVLRRGNGAAFTASRPEIETFGENIGTLSREVFLLNFFSKNYRGILEKLIEGEGSYENVIRCLEYHKLDIGLEAKGILLSMDLERNQEK